MARTSSFLNSSPKRPHASSPQLEAKAAAVSATAANGWIRGGALAEKLCGCVGSLRLAIPIGHLYFCEFFRLGKLFRNDDHHSKPITKANGVVRRQLQGNGG